jgi:hypothetical protein
VHSVCELTLWYLAYRCPHILIDCKSSSTLPPLDEYVCRKKVRFSVTLFCSGDIRSCAINIFGAIINLHRRGKLCFYMVHAPRMMSLKYHQFCHRECWSNYIRRKKECVRHQRPYRSCATRPCMRMQKSLNYSSDRLPPSNIKFQFQPALFS